MTTYTLATVPQWMRESSLFRELSSNEESNNDILPITNDKFKENSNINNIEDFKLIHEICKFWQLDFPNSYCIWPLKCIENKIEVFNFYYSILDNRDPHILSLITDLMKQNLITERISAQEALRSFNNYIETLIDEIFYDISKKASVGIRKLNFSNSKALKKLGEFKLSDSKFTKVKNSFVSLGYRCIEKEYDGYSGPSSKYKIIEEIFF